MKTSSIITAIAATLGIVLGTYFFMGSEKSQPIQQKKLNNIPSQEFLLQTENDTIIETEGGLTIFIPQDAFVDQDGNIVEKANLEVKEVDKISEAIQNKISNVSTDGKVLQPEKTFQFTVKTAKGRELQINPNNPITIEIPTKEKSLNLIQKKEENLLNLKKEENLLNLKKRKKSLRVKNYLLTELKI